MNTHCKHFNRLTMDLNSYAIKVKDYHHNNNTEALMNALTTFRHFEVR